MNGVLGETIPLASAPLTVTSLNVEPGSYVSVIARLRCRSRGTFAALPGYVVAGKTGTAAKPDSHGGYSNSAYVASFVGFVPATRPRIVVLVTVDEPHGAIWGGTVAAPAFRQIAEPTLQHLAVPPDAAR